VHGKNYPPPPNAVMFAKLAQFGQLAGMAFMFFGKPICAALNLGVSDQFFDSLKNNRMMVIGGLFLLNNMAQGQLATGAFEVQYNGKMVFSKLEVGRMPTLDEIIKPLQDAGLRPIGSASFETQDM